MNEPIRIKVQNDLPVAVDSSEHLDAPEKSLAERREDLRVRLQINRKILGQKLIESATDKQFPRSTTMRFLSNDSTRHLIQRVAGAAIGMQAFKSIRYGYSLVQFVRSAYSAFKATRNVVKAKEGKPIEN